MIYLDSAATTLQKPPAVAAAAARAVDTLASPGRGGHRPAMEAARTAYRCRELAGELLGVSDPERVVFTMNATHALNIAIHSLVKPGDAVVLSGWEHNAVTRPLHALNADVRVAAGRLFDPDALLEDFAALLTPEVRCCICTQVSNAFGMVMPVSELAALCRERSVPLIVDASQGAGCLPVDCDGWGARFVAMPGHKGLYGPQGTGLLLCGEGVEPLPLLQGGTGSVSLTQEMPEFLPDRLEPGTHNLPGITGLLEGLRFVKEKGPAAILAHERSLTALAAEGLGQIPGVTVFSASDPARQGGVLSFLADGWDVEDAAGWLSDHGVALRAGYHCAPLAHQTAGTLATGTLRASFSAFNTRREASRLIELTGRMVRSR